MPWREGQPCTQLSGQPSSAMMGRPSVQCAPGWARPRRHRQCTTSPAHPRGPGAGRRGWPAARARTPEQEYQGDGVGGAAHGRSTEIEWVGHRARRGATLPGARAPWRAVPIAAGRAPAVPARRGCVLHHQAEFGVAFHDQAAVEEQRVRVLLALGQQQKEDRALRPQCTNPFPHGARGRKGGAGPGEVRTSPGVRTSMRRRLPRAAGRPSRGGWRATPTLSAVTSNSEPGTPAAAR